MSDDDALDWDEWTDDIVTAIEDEEFSSGNLRKIVRAVFALKRKTHLLPNEIAARLAPTPVREPEEDVFTGTICQTRHRPGPGTFEVGGKYYDKLDVIGLTFRPSLHMLGVRRGTNWRGVTFYVLEINSKNILVVMKSRPQRMDARLASLYNSNRPIAIGKDILKTILEGQIT